MKLQFLLPLLAGAAVSACVSAPQPSSSFPASPFVEWNNSAPAYELFPGDAVELTVYSARGLSRTLTVAPDGRIHPPLVAPIMAAGRSTEDVERELLTALDIQLVDPRIDLRPAAFASQRVFVGGEVESPGVFELPGQIGAMEAVMLAGGMKTTANPSEVMVLRRSTTGDTMMRLTDLMHGDRNPERADNYALQRFDVVFVPRSGIAEFNLFVQQYLRDALPIDFGLYYGLNENN